MFFARPLVAAALFGVLAAAGMTATDANAQQIYRIVGADGRITFSDKPPLDPAAKAQPAKVVGLQSSGSSDLASLPFELRQAASRYPVTLYSAPSCSACTSGRAMLVGRGIPFAERTVATSADIEALKRMGNATTLPVLTIGGQQLKGFGESEWTQFLDAAGYPKSSQLPSGYIPAPARPLVAAQDAPQEPAAAPAPQARTRAAEAPREAAAAEPADNPAGIKF
jgi:glutaredoxin